MLNRWPLLKLIAIAGALAGCEDRVASQDEFASNQREKEAPSGSTVAAGSMRYQLAYCAASVMLPSRPALKYSARPDANGTPTLAVYMLATPAFRYAISCSRSVDPAAIVAESALREAHDSATVGLPGLVVQRQAGKGFKVTRFESPLGEIHVKTIILGSFAYSLTIGPAPDVREEDAEQFFRSLSAAGAEG